MLHLLKDLMKNGLLSAFVIQFWQQTAFVAADQAPFSLPIFPDRPILDFTSTAPHIFSSIRYLLEQWPNTYIPNGHSIVPCEIPAFTTLYHGRRDEKLPSSPEWFAFDAEMSFGIMGSTRNSHLLTYQNVKPVQCLYFDGMSAALMGTGSLDSQMVFLCGNTTCSFGDDNEPWRGIFDEYARATALCNWIQENQLGGLGWGVEGIVRMNAGFEMIWCNFTSPSIRMTSHVNVSVPLLPEGFYESEDSWMGSQGSLEVLASRADPDSTATSSSASEIPTGDPDMPAPPNWRSRSELEPFLRSQSFEWYRSATWHMGSSGSSIGRADGRVKLNPCGFLSYYDPMLKEFSSAFAEEERSRLNLTRDGIWRGLGEGDGDNDDSSSIRQAMKELSTRRRSHRLSQITPFESSLLSDAVLHMLRTLNRSSSFYSSESPMCTGIDWIQKTIDITSRFSAPLSQTLDLLTHPLPPLPPDNTTTNTRARREYIASLRSKSHAMLMPYLTYPLTAASFESIHARCMTSQTSALHFDRQQSLHSRLLATERTVLTALESVMSEICITTLSLAFDVEEVWQSYYQSHPNTTTTSTSSTAGGKTSSRDPIPDLPENTLFHLVTKHRRSISLLRAWLGWFPNDDQTMGCRRVCAVDEFCFVPIWPLLFLEPRDDNGRGGGGGGGRFGRGKERGSRRPPPPHRGGNPWERWEKELWEPRCVKVKD